jgi:hypothetical protein
LFAPKEALRQVRSPSSSRLDPEAVTIQAVKARYVKVNTSEFALLLSDDDEPPTWLVAVYNIVVERENKGFKHS